MHFVIEAYKRSIERATFLRFLNYVLFFPSFISGPINRFGHCVHHSGGGEFTRDIGPGLGRIVDGLFKKIVLSVVLPYTLAGTGPGQMLWQAVVGLYALALYFYFDFSGYTDLAIGCARIMGFVLPENFNPLFSRGTSSSSGRIGTCL